MASIDGAIAPAAITEPLESNLLLQSLTPTDLHAGEAPNIKPELEQGNQESVEGGDADSKAAEIDKWPGWPGYNVYRLVVPVTKVGIIIGRKGELVKKMTDETRARIRILEAPRDTADRIVLISGKEELDMQLPPAMDAAIRVFKRVSGLSTNEGDLSSTPSVADAFCSIRLLVAHQQAISIIGKQGSTIKSIQESTGALVRILPEEELPSYATSDERLVEIHGDSIKVLTAFEAVLGQLRKFLVDQTVLPIFEKTFNALISQERPAAPVPALMDTWADRTQLSLRSAPGQQVGSASDYAMSLKRDPLYERETHLDTNIPQPGMSLFEDRLLGAMRSSGLNRAGAPVVTQMTQTMQVPLSYAEDIIGIGGSNIAYIRRTSGAILTIQESGGLPDEITVEIKGSTPQVQMAQQLIREFITNHREPAPSLYDKVDPGLASYSQLPDTNYRPSYSSQQLGGGGYGSSDAGGYGTSNMGGGYTNYRY